MESYLISRAGLINIHIIFIVIGAQLLRSMDGIIR